MNLDMEKQEKALKSSVRGLKRTYMNQGVYLKLWGTGYYARTNSDGSIEIKKFQP